MIKSGIGRTRQQRLVTTIEVVRWVRPNNPGMSIETTVAVRIPNVQDQHLPWEKEKPTEETRT